MAGQHKKCRFNNLTLGNARKTDEYQALLIDLALVGIVDKTDAEGLLGYEIPDYLRPPAWSLSSPAATREPEDD